MKYPDASTVRFDHGHKLEVLGELRAPNECICGYCRQQAVLARDIRHPADCPMRKRPHLVKPPAGELA